MEMANPTLLQRTRATTVFPFSKTRVPSEALALVPGLISLPATVRTLSPLQIWMETATRISQWPIRETTLCQYCETSDTGDLSQPMPLLQRWSSRHQGSL